MRRSEKGVARSPALVGRPVSAAPFACAACTFGLVAFVGASVATSLVGVSVAVSVPATVAGIFGGWGAWRRLRRAS